ncbi:hypothetical protein Q9290_09170 [Oceanimonas sp. CHS3-5]|uniref:hypothetical protein n=1 Tax=Oceanimonas sp. CHS3-5 TaxID=3068186 RepID=UPI00273EA57D|nr:hypothetical protein [Oceanimonas sp. CHS3-5]MDP5292458.1 hypothetical protein [Oceanimonas sp. CHS3-5]
MAELKTSFLTYQDDNINSTLAGKLVVYRYPLTMSRMKWWQWRECLDEQLSESSYPYYMYNKNLYVALPDESHVLPRIQTQDKTFLVAEKVEYLPELNPVWLKLILRQVGHQVGQTRGYRALGKPLLKLNEWGGDNPGIEAIDIEGAVRQRKDKNTTEVKITFSNVSLRKLKVESPRTGKLWLRDQDGWLGRWFPGNEELGELYQEIKKSKGIRKQRPFIDLKSPEGLKTSRSYFIQQFVSAYVKSAHDYGFYLDNEVLHLDKYPSTHKPDKKRRLKSLPLEKFPITLIDARENLDSPISEVKKWFVKLLEDEGLNIKIDLFSNQPVNLQELKLKPCQRYLVVLDQGKGLPQDPYEITRNFSDDCIVQHIILNPYELDDDFVVEQWFIRDDEDNITQVFDDYFDYTFEQITEFKSIVSLKLVVAVKELHFKQLMRDPAATVTDYLPNHNELLKDLTLISEGYLFTLSKDKPVVVEFSLSDPIVVKELDGLLERHDINCKKLIGEIVNNWPYGYTPEEEIRKDVDGFLKRQVVLFIGKERVLLQSPGNHTPILTPDGLGEVMPLLEGRKSMYPVSSWLLPADYDCWINEDNVRTLLSLPKEDCDRIDKLLKCLPELCKCWQQTVYDHFSLGRVAYNRLRKEFNSRASDLIGGDKKVMGQWWILLSSFIERPVYDPRTWLRKIPGLTGLWFDAEKGYYLVGDLNNLNLTINRQPSIYRWHALRGDSSPEVIMPLLDVDFIRIGRFAGRVFPSIFIRSYRDYEE